MIERNFDCADTCLVPCIPLWWILSFSDDGDVGDHGDDGDFLRCVCVIRSCQPSVSSSTSAQANPRPREKAESVLASALPVRATSETGSPAKVQSSSSAMRMPGVALP